MSRIQTPYDEWMERCYLHDEDGEDVEPLERDPDDWRDEMMERHRMEQEM